MGMKEKKIIHWMKQTTAKKIDDKQNKTNGTHKQRRKNQQTEKKSKAKADMAINKSASMLPFLLAFISLTY